MINIYKNINSKLSNAKSVMRYLPVVLKSGKGIRVTDIDGKTYLDCVASAGTIPFGHNHPIINNAIRDFSNNSYPVQTMDIPTELQIDFTNKLYDFLPKKFSETAKIQMCSPAGGDAVEAAIKLAKIATGRNTILAFQGGYHGQTFGGASISGKVRGSFPYSGMSDVHFLPYPSDYRCPLSIGSEGYLNLLEYTEKLFDNPQSGIGKPAAVILETVQGEGGVNPAPIPWMKEIRRITEERQIPLIIDEIQTGFCRTGKKFGFEHADIQPDIVCFAKAIGGSMPLAAIMHHQKLDKWTEYQHSGTWRGNQLAFLTGLRGLEYMEENKLWLNAESMGNHFKNELNKFKNDYPFIGDIRGRGLMLAIEIIHNEENNSVNPELADKIQKKCMENGLLVLRGGPFKNVIRLMPPLNVTQEEIEEVIDIFIRSLKKLY